MSYDILIFEKGPAPKEKTAFLQWYEAQTAWSEGHHYDDLAVASPSLRSWFVEMIDTFPPLNCLWNGPLIEADLDDDRAADYTVSSNIIYVAFSWSQTALAHKMATSLAAKHGLGFFDASWDEIRF